MAVGTVSNRSAGVDNFATGGATGDGTALVVTLGWKPKYIKVFNETDAITYEWNANMAATKTFKTVTAGTMTVDTGTAILDNNDGTFTLASGVNISAKVITWVASA